MDDLLKFLMENWGTIAGIVGAALAVLGAIAELTPFEWDNAIIKVIRGIWAKIPVFTRDASKMGTGSGK